MKELANPQMDPTKASLLRAPAFAAHLHVKPSLAAATADALSASPLAAEEFR